MIGRGKRDDGEVWGDGEREEDRMRKGGEGGELGGEEGGERKKFEEGKSRREGGGGGGEGIIQRGRREVIGASLSESHTGVLNGS